MLFKTMPPDLYDCYLLHFFDRLSWEVKWPKTAQEVLALIHQKPWSPQKFADHLKSLSARKRNSYIRGLRLTPGEASARETKVLLAQFGAKFPVAP